MARNTPREWAIAICGGLALAAALVAILRPAPDAETPPAPAPAPPPVAAPPVTGPAPPPASPLAAAAGNDLKLAGLRTGPDGGMAIIALGGRQYRLTPGQRLPGGLTLRRTEPGRAILSGPAGEQVIAFADAPRASAGPALPPGGDPTPWRLALTRAGGGWQLGRLDTLPMLARAGLRTGDILISANGQELLSEEKIIELPQELAANGQLVLQFTRNGRPQEARVKP